MKVLLLFPMADGQTGPAIKYAFEQLDHQVESVDAKLLPETSYSTACAYNPDLVFCSRTRGLTEDVRKIKERFKTTPVCMWNVDVKHNMKRWTHLFPLIELSDYHFVVEKSQIPEWKKLNPNTFFLPQGLQNEVYNKPKKITDADKERYACDISFAGRRRGHRWPYLERIEEMNLDFKKWGCAGRGKVFNEEHNKMASLSKVNFTCSAGDDLDSCVSVRNYKIIGAGGFLLEKYRAGLEHLFPFLVFYVSPNDLVDKIRYWLNHEEERKARAEEGYKWVHENATYTHRIRKALEIMGL